MLFSSALKICFVWEQYESGGVDNYLKYLTENWPSKLDSIYIIANSNNKGAKRFFKILNKNVAINYIESKSFFISTNKYLNSKFFKIFRYALIPFLFIASIIYYLIILNKYNFDVVISQNGGYPGSYGNLAAIIASSILKIKCRILVIHHAATKPDFLQTNFRLLIEKILSKSVTSIIAISNATKSTIKVNTRLLDDQNCFVTVINNGVNKPEILTKKDHYTGILTVAVIGRLDNYKGHDDLLIAIGLLEDDIKNKIKIKFIGDYSDSQYQLLTNLAEKYSLSRNLTFTGYLDLELSEIFSGIDVLAVMTKSFEGFGLTIIESLLHGIPIISTRIGIAKELYRHDSEYIFDIGDHIAIKQSIEKIIKNYSNNVSSIPDYVQDNLFKYEANFMAFKYRLLIQNDLLKNV